MNIESQINDIITQIKDGIDTFNEEQDDITAYYPAEMEMKLYLPDQDSYVTFTLCIDEGTDKGDEQ